MADNGENMNIPTEAMMCVFEKESGFDGGARSETGCSGIGQICMAESQMAINHMKKYAPEHFKAFSDKFEKDGKGNIDQVFNASRNSGKNNEKRRELLRSDPNFGAAMAYALMDYKKKGGENGKGKPIGNDRDLQRLINSYGPGDSGYADSIMGCMKNNRWLVDRRKKK